MKRLIALLLCFCVLLGAISGSASAAKKELSKEEKLKQSARQSYTKSLYAAGKSSFHGYCGLMTSCQMRALGINTWRVTNDGNKQFDYYAALDVTSGGYGIMPYYVDECSMEEALNQLSRNGTKDVYNILVGFQWTNTVAGSRYGHAVFINGILDGTVYFVESYDCSLNRYYPEGSVITCSIPEFVAYYESWTAYEGLIWFGDGGYAAACETYGTDLMVMTRFDTTLRSQPAVAGQGDCQVLRKVAAGERLRAVEILDDPMGDRYYKIDDGDVSGYVAAGAVYVIRVNPEDLELMELQMPERIPAGEKPQISGTVLAKNGAVGSVELTVTDTQGGVVANVTLEAEGFSAELAPLAEELPALEEGIYQVQIHATCAQTMPVQQQLRTMQERILLGQRILQVGGSGHAGKAYPMVQKQVQQQRDGWFFEIDRWLCCDDGQPIRGWVKDTGVTYYLDENGAAVTGWQTIDGNLYKFSGSGALLRNMEAKYEGVTYTLGDNGVATKKGKK